MEGPDTARCGAQGVHPRTAPSPDWKKQFQPQIPPDVSLSVGASHRKLPGYHASVSLETFWNDVLERAVRFG